MTTKTALTSNEMNLLRAIATSEYNCLNGGDGTDPAIINNGVWGGFTFFPVFKNPKTFSGVVTSLSKKGMIGVKGDVSADKTVNRNTTAEEIVYWLTKEGFDALNSKETTVKTSKTPAAKSSTKSAAKPAPKAKVERKRTAFEREATVSADAKITVLAKENPRREGTTAAKTFALYKTGMTVGAWREACSKKDLDPGYLHSDIRNGFIKVK